MKSKETTSCPGVKKSGGPKLLLAMWAVALSAVTNPLPSFAGIVAHWTFDETSGSVAHDSVGAFNGNLSASGAAFVSGGISGNAISLNRAANGFVNMGNVLGLTSGDFSIVSWVKTSPGDATPVTVVVGKHASGFLNGYFLGLNTSGNQGQANKVYFYDSALPGQEPVSTTSVNDGAWHQIVGVYHAGGNALIYVDGAPAEASKASRPIIANTVAFLIGGINFSGVPGSIFNGLIDDVQIYNSALFDWDADFLFQHPGQVVPDCSQQLAAAQAQLAAASATNAALQAQLVAANATNATLQVRLDSANATNTALTAQLAAANTMIASLQAQLAAANGANTALQAQLAACNTALAAANQNIQQLQNEIEGLLLPLQLLTQDFRVKFKDPQFKIRGETTVEQMQNLVGGILDLPRGQQLQLFLDLGGKKHIGVRDVKAVARAE